MQVQPECRSVERRLAVLVCGCCRRAVLEEGVDTRLVDAVWSSLATWNGLRDELEACPPRFVLGVGIAFYIIGKSRSPIWLMDARECRAGGEAGVGAGVEPVIYPSQEALVMRR